MQIELLGIIVLIVVVIFWAISWAAAESDYNKISAFFFTLAFVPLIGCWTMCGTTAADKYEFHQHYQPIYLETLRDNDGMRGSFALFLGSGGGEMHSQTRIAYYTKRLDPAVNEYVLKRWEQDFDSSINIVEKDTITHPYLRIIKTYYKRKLFGVEWTVHENESEKTRYFYVKTGTVKKEYNLDN